MYLLGFDDNDFWPVLNDCISYSYEVTLLFHTVSRNLQISMTGYSHLFLWGMHYTLEQRGSTVFMNRNANRGGGGKKNRFHGTTGGFSGQFLFFLPTRTVLLRNGMYRSYMSSLSERRSSNIIHPFSAYRACAAQNNELATLLEKFHNVLHKACTVHETPCKVKNVSAINGQWILLFVWDKKMFKFFGITHPSNACRTMQWAMAAFFVLRNANLPRYD